MELKPFIIFEPQQLQFKLKQITKYYGFVDIRYQRGQFNLDPVSILEIGVIITNQDYREIASYHSFVQPFRSLSKSQLKKRRYEYLTLTQLEQAPKWPIVWRELVQFISPYQDNIRLFTFDRLYPIALDTCSQHYGLNRPFKLWSLESFLGDWKLFGTKVYPHLPYLGMIYELMEIQTIEEDREQEMSLLRDVRLLKELVKKGQNGFPPDVVAYEMIKALKHPTQTWIESITLHPNTPKRCLIRFTTGGEMELKLRETKRKSKRTYSYRWIGDERTLSEQEWSFIRKVAFLHYQAPQLFKDWDRRKDEKTLGDWYQLYLTLSNASSPN